LSLHVEGIKIAGVKSFSLIDFPGEPCAMIFTTGCNLRCPWCHNWRIAYGEEATIDRTKEALEKLRSLREHLDAVCVTGGEPTIHFGLPSLLHFLKFLGYKIKLDTNGTNPKLLENVSYLLDYVAVDVKACPKKYPKATGIEQNVWPQVEKSIEILREKRIPHELRMVKVPGLTDGEDVEFLRELGESMSGEKIFLRPFQPTSNFSGFGVH